ncbi:MAG: NAD(P)/FAD-dependent oxidoreductase [Oscillospiraceae bacterium]|nr:NAD(P)/FAD-dependent oxidoreductase [Oscillospiraceae bacterium]
MANIIIIGGGAAGLFAAGTALKSGHTVTVLEHGDAVGRKILITGKGRCNVTNNCDEETFLKNVRTNPRFLYSGIYAWPPEKTMQLFEQFGVPLKTERGRRVFPVSDRAQDIVAALQRYADGAAVLFAQAKGLLIEENQVRGVKLAGGRSIAADAVIVATGGVSYSVTGSTGDGYRFAKAAGHTIVTPTPSLVSLVERGNTAKRMMGLSLKNVKLTLLQNGKPKFSEQGEMLFTHFGISGPLVLSASAHIGDMNKYKYSVEIDLKPALDEQTLYKRIAADFDILSNKDAANCLVKLLPKKMEPVMLEMWGVEPTRKVNQITRLERQQLVKLMKAFPLEIKERGDLAHAVITSGGVSVKEINPKTMESKLVSGLYFAGEVLDVDAYTGGYNLQIAFATAYAAATHIDEE